jgi:hypothetical protein
MKRKQQRGFLKQIWNYALVSVVRTVDGKVAFMVEKAVSQLELMPSVLVIENEMATGYFNHAEEWRADTLT